MEGGDSVGESDGSYVSSENDFIIDQISIGSKSNDAKDENFIDNHSDQVEILPSVSFIHVFLFVFLVVGIGVLSTLLAQLLIEDSKRHS